MGKTNIRCDCCGKIIAEENLWVYGASTLMACGEECEDILYRRIKESLV